MDVVSTTYWRLHPKELGRDSSELGPLALGDMLSRIAPMRCDEGTTDAMNKHSVQPPLGRRGDEKGSSMLWRSHPLSISAIWLAVLHFCVAKDQASVKRGDGHRPGVSQVASTLHVPGPPPWGQTRTTQPSERPEHVIEEKCETWQRFTSLSPGMYG
ncbi:hypothetical protein DL770_006140 [Monosporascus sp. CRB-9-2]|nr:hypothetical protein DL770_006140 [Monosporascus sp. CRB-9-2]